MSYKAIEAVKADVAARYAGESIEALMQLAVQAEALDVDGPSTPTRTVAVAIRSYLTERVAAHYVDAPTADLLAETRAALEDDANTYKSQTHAAMHRGCERVLEARFPEVRDRIDMLAGDDGGWEAAIAPHGTYTAWVASLYTAAAVAAGEKGGE